MVAGSTCCALEACLRLELHADCKLDTRQCRRNAQLDTVGTLALALAPDKAAGAGSRCADFEVVGMDQQSTVGRHRHLGPGVGARYASDGHLYAVVLTCNMRSELVD